MQATDDAVALPQRVIGQGEPLTLLQQALREDQSLPLGLGAPALPIPQSQLGWQCVHCAGPAITQHPDRHPAGHAR